MPALWTSEYREVLGRAARAVEMPAMGTSEYREVLGGAAGAVEMPAKQPDRIPAEISHGDITWQMVELDQG